MGIYVNPIKEILPPDIASSKTHNHVIPPSIKGIELVFLCFIRIDNIAHGSVLKSFFEILGR